MQTPSLNENSHDEFDYQSDKKEYLTCHVENQSFGIPVLQIQDILSQQRVTYVPLAPPEVEGSLNLRGRIVTAVNIRKKLGISPRGQCERSMSIVVEHKDDLYSLTVDSVGEVVSLPNSDFEKNPATLDKSLKSISSGIYRLKSDLLVILDVSNLIESLLVMDGIEQ